MVADIGLLQAGALGAATVGLVSSLHCALMCGPLACSAMVRSASRSRDIAVSYLLARALSYTLVGGLLGGFGGTLSVSLATQVRPYLPWVMASALVLTATGWLRHLPALPGLGRVATNLARASANLAPMTRAGAIGALTPLLPCGLLFGLFAASLAAGTALGGAVVMGAFALGSTPALALAQAGTRFVALRSRMQQVVFQRLLPLAAAVWIVVRTVAVAQQGPQCH